MLVLWAVCGSLLEVFSGYLMGVFRQLLSERECLDFSAYVLMH